MADIRLDVSDAIATVTLDRPRQLNAFTTAMGAELIEAFDTCDRDDSIRAVIITGAGRAFCAGADLSAGAETFAAGDNDAAESFRDSGGELVLRMYESRKPIIAAVNGPAVGVGITMTLAADFRIAVDNARIGFVFNRRGIVPESCSSWFLPRLVPMQTALDWVYSGRLVEAAEALEAGLFSALYPADTLLDEAHALARRVTEHSAPVSVALSRQMLWRNLGADHPMIAHRIESRGIYHRGASADAREGVTAFLEKRPARFPDSVDRDLPDIFGDDLAVPPFRP
ncbi:crotonase/enoyl-CoA hydratase family protein [Nocardia implantans]|uniref:Crotonase/enoyl-CoA hydratase family protein n=1 Tax=Nocardia implantans TaxID=3108168 RepID=A0ABU6AXI9_9NOCA|nr:MULTISPECIES: crotonase/enoyl-CoA hydratase family protein [unclassified Nocardia]MBF6193714.1 crotonase/enoyl-CoA hydratase family protein [Nocardia beijingensis]MEA3529548.1 crotonase/enoyl-CoA hydratase family protein [Nocardia sp. CDC192]MEB3512134.1 crotonase/enoyl-CoA hydratase family protein [Nocardia sp. CDC186]